MINLYREFLAEVDAESLYRNTGELYEIELKQTFSGYHAAARKAAELLRKTGIPGVELITFPADGQTAYQDKITPLGWEASCGTLTVRTGDEPSDNWVIADYQRHPFHLIKGSVGGSPDGEEVRIISAEQLRAGADARGALVLIPPGNQPCSGNALAQILDSGARGVVSDYAMNADDAPDGIQWCNAFTERANWHVTADDRPFIAFSITPADGARLRRVVGRGEVRAEIRSDARRSVSTVDAVTALIPGRRSEEFWIIAHLYEPLSNDNSSGVAAAIESARLLMASGECEFSLRLIFALEYYGFAAYAARRGNCLRDQVIGACDYDAMYLRRDWSINFRCAAPGSPFYGNYLAKMFAADLEHEPDVPAVNCLNSFACMYDDDSALGDPTIGIPVVWPIRTGKNFWHNSKQTMNYVQKSELARGTALYTAYVSAVIQPQKAVLRRILPVAAAELAAELPRAVGSKREHLTRRYEILDGDLENFQRVFPAAEIAPLRDGLRREYLKLASELSDAPPDSPRRREAAALVPRRLTTGFPHDLAAIPPAERVALPGNVLYGPLAAILANMDGRRDLATIFRQVEHEICRLMSEEELAKMLTAVRYLARYGYLAVTGKGGAR